MKIERICFRCNKSFYVERKYVNRGGGIFCSKKCKSTGMFADPHRYDKGKKCTICNLIKMPDEFGIKTIDGRKHLQSWCKSCMNSIKKDRYQSDPSLKERTVTKNKRVKERNRKFILEYLSNRVCTDCGESDIVVLEFDHIGEKKFGISYGVQIYSLKTLIKEIDKCEVVCANCHRRRTAKQFNQYKYRACSDNGSTLVLQTNRHGSKPCRSTKFISR